MTDHIQTASASENVVNGYCTVFVGTEKGKLPYTVFARSDYHAARLISQETGYLAEEADVEGPYRRG